ncbi:uncharacterized protein LOC125676970 [Ostrea edulis]|uniref:uncharacterized protein LOC125676970 n=1 Tax=Ostrea edulis TaxID=37623 RepID=UPI0024AFF39F|nr:uncharacterized protein LOC125676970 [Ostrea edulis]
MEGSTCSRRSVSSFLVQDFKVFEIVMYSVAYNRMAWIVFVFILESVSAQYLSYGCYPEPLEVSCSTGQIHPLSVSVGAIVSSQDCPKTYLKAMPGSDVDDICIEDELSPEQSYTYHENCIGQTSCSPNATEANLSHCSGSMSTNLTTLMEMEYECIAKTMIITLGSDRNVNKTSDTGGSLHLQGNSYVREGRNTQTNGFQQSCSICSSANTSIIELEVLDLRLSSDNNGCTQTITLDNGTDIISVTCKNNTNFTKDFVFPTNTSCLTLTVSNSSGGGYFWFKFTNADTIRESIRIECSPVVATPTITSPLTSGHESHSCLVIILGVVFGLGLLLLSFLIVAIACKWKKPLFISRHCKPGKQNIVHPVSATEMEEGDGKDWVVENSRMEKQNDEVLLRNQDIMHTTEYNDNTYELQVNRNVVKLEPITKSRRKKRKKKKKKHKESMMEERNDCVLSGDGEKQ